MSEQYKVVYSPSAVDDLDSIYSYIAYELMAETTARNQVIRIFYGGRDIESILDSCN
ncbi:MAG: hypothetical protein LUH36_05395 [Oscillospiraceae bacterium]|nr:hypothetical protein [Oscillospiraceae bacterium]MCD7818800.1 hypothetical protein [Lachnospiraceae bacterium]